MQGIAGQRVFDNRSPGPSRPRSTWIRGQRWLAGLVMLVLGLGCASCYASEMAFAVTQLGSDEGGLCGRGCKQVISAKGDIDSGTSDRFLNFLSNHQQEQNLRSVVLLDSGGGSVREAMKLGAAFRQMSAEVIVGEAVRVRGTDRMSLSPGQCMSACVYAFFGGSQRVVPSSSQLGIHRMILDTGSLGWADASGMPETYGSPEIVAALTAYTRSMGVDPGVIVQAERIAHDNIHILTPSEISRWRLARSRP